ncbi:flavodoxin family protein [Amycolatopsis alba DSM 44262]|uniref:Flavodoxin family protein n=1 Tax=Amycolatopsis alba DSM 44262 TaxID=1125972 RepID=A0A229S8Y9_AMYAL|nr:flavodoxin family protein [Amycolatopsis alba DSM 44262]
MNSDLRVAIAYHGGRGHTARLAEAVEAGAKARDGVVVDSIDVSRITAGDWFRLDDADAIVFGAPTYMGTASAAFHTFAEASSRRWFTARWVDKIAAGFTNSGSKAGDKSSTLSYFATLAAQHGMLWVSLGLPPGWNSTKGGPGDLNRLGFHLGAAAQSNVDEKPAAMHASDLATAEHLGARVARCAQRFVLGRERES